METLLPTVKTSCKPLWRRELQTLLDVLSVFLGTIDITILPEVSTEGLESSDVEKLTEKVYSQMCKEYEKCIDKK